MKKLLVAGLFIVGLFAVSLFTTGCDDEGLSCAAECLADYNADVAACEASAKREAPLSCQEQYEPDYTSCLSNCAIATK